MNLSVQLYTVRSLMAEDAKGTLFALRDLGLQYVETAGLYELSAQEFRAILEEAGLKVSGMHVGFSDLENNLEKVVSDARELGCSCVTNPWVSIEEVWKPDLEGFMRRNETVGRKLRDAGISYSFHNHGGEVVDEKLKAFFDGTDSDSVRAQFDLGWIFFAKDNPLDYLERYAGRIDSVHLKDMDLNADPVDVVAGTGEIDWAPILAKCEEIQVPFGVIELDNPGDDPLGAVAQCVEFFRNASVRG